MTKGMKSKDSHEAAEFFKSLDAELYEGNEGENRLEVTVSAQCKSSTDAQCSISR